MVRRTREAAGRPAARSRPALPESDACPCREDGQAPPEKGTPRGPRCLAGERQGSASADLRREALACLRRKASVARTWSIRFVRCAGGGPRAGPALRGLYPQRPHGHRVHPERSRPGSQGARGMTCDAPLRGARRGRRVSAATPQPGAGGAHPVASVRSRRPGVQRPAPAPGRACGAPRVRRGPRCSR